MYCQNCGKTVDEGALYCTNCGANLYDAQNPHRTNNQYSTPIQYSTRNQYDAQNQNIPDDKPSFGFAVLGFLSPLVGLILYLVYESKKPKRAKSAGKGAIISVITRVAITIIFVIVYVVLTASVLSNTANGTEANTSTFGSVFAEETTDQILKKYVDVTFGEFKVTNNGYYSQTSLDIKVKNKAEERYTYFITIEAIDKNGARIDTDTIYADKLNAGQEMNLTAFNFVEQDKIDQFKEATFKVLEINKYDF